jgi:hypothetical protein
MAARQYRSTVDAKTLSAEINNSIASMTLNNITTLPSTYPYTLVIDPDTPSEEIVTVTANVGGNTLSITRGQDGTSAQAHNSAAVVKHMITARDLQDAQNHIEATTGGYTITNDGEGNTTNDLHGIAAGEGAVVGTLKTQTLTNKTLTSPVINGGAALTVTSTDLNFINQLKNPSTNAQTGTTYTLVLADDNKFVEMDNSSSNTVTIPLNSSVAFPVGAQVTVITTGAGLTTVSPTSGVTLNYYSPTNNSTARIRARYSAVTLVKRATDTWIAIGNLL